MKREEANGDRIRPGDVYEYSCRNDQGYGYMIPVKTSGGWDFIDTYQLGIPLSKDGETSDDASIRRIIELGNGEHDGYVSNQTSMFYHRNAHFGKAAVPYGLRLAFNLNDYNPTPRRECEDYDDSEVEEMDNPLEEIKDDAHWFIEQYAREAWCEEVTRLGRQL